MKNKVRVSVIMATYNTEKKKLMDAIESILNQTYKEFEFIIVCDGLVKDYEIVKRYSDNRIKVIFNDSNIGLARSLNKALAISTGKYIVRMDSDDISLKNRIELQVDYMEKNPDIVVSDMRALCFGSYNGLKYNLFSKPDEIQVQLLYKNCLIHPAAIIRSEVLKKYNIRYNETFEVAQDYELWNRLVKYGKITQLKKIGLKYRVHSKQISIDRRELQNKNKIRVLKSNLEELDGLGFLELFLVLSGEVKISNENKERLKPVAKKKRQMPKTSEKETA